MSYTTFTSASRIARTRAEDGEPDIRCKCPSGRRAALRRAGPSTKNAGRLFYCCPAGRDEAKRCNFFLWQDEVVSGKEVVGTPLRGITTGAGSSTSVGSASKASPSANRSVGNVLGGSGAGPSTPSRRAAFPNFFSPRSTTTTPTAARVPAFVPVPDDEDVDEDTGGIDWTAVDADTLEAEALTPLKRASKSSASVAAANGVGTGPSAGSAVNPGTPASRLHERLVAAAGKRKREDGEGSEGDGESEGGPTPKRSNNPFIDSTSMSTPTTPTTARTAPTVPGSTHSVVSVASTTSAISASGAPASHAAELAAHPVLAPVFASLDGLGEHFARQDRLVRAAEAMKRSMRTTIRNLQDRVRELEAEVAGLKKGRS